MKKYVKRAISGVNHIFGKKENTNLRDYQLNQVILVGVDKGILDETLLLELISHHPKRLILLGSSMGEVKQMKQQLERDYPKLNLECLVDEKALSVGLERVREQYHPDLVLSIKEGAIEYLAA